MALLHGMNDHGRCNISHSIQNLHGRGSHCTNSVFETEIGPCDQKGYVATCRNLCFDRYIFIVFLKFIYSND